MINKCETVAPRLQKYFNMKATVVSMIRILNRNFPNTVPYSPTRLALGFLQFRIDIGCDLTETRFPWDLAVVPPVVEIGPP